MSIDIVEILPMKWNSVESRTPTTLGYPSRYCTPMSTLREETVATVCRSAAPSPSRSFFPGHMATRLTSNLFLLVAAQRLWGAHGWGGVAVCRYQADTDESILEAAVTSLSACP